MMQNLRQDLAYAVQQSLRRLGFSASVVLVLALGIGANAAMFTVLEGTLFQPLPYRNAEELVTLKPTDSKGEHGLSGLADEKVWAARTHTLSQIAYFDAEQAYLNTQASDGVLSEQKVGSITASANLFATLGVAPALGRSFNEEEQRPGREHAVVLSDEVWRSQFHADESVLGKTVRLDDEVATVIGVMPAGFRFPAQQDRAGAQVWRPAAIAPKDMTRSFDAAYYEMIGRRVAGASVADVAMELSALQKQLMSLYSGDISPDLAPMQVEVMDYRRSLNAADQRKALLALLGAVGMLWLIACANVACLMLARTAARRREIAVRSALGASAWRLARQTMVESLLLSLSGGVLGLGLAVVTLRIFRHSLATQFSSHLALYPDMRVMMALLALSVLSAALFGVVPAWSASSIAVEQALRQDGAQAGTGRHQHRLQRVLVVAELAITLLMLVCCGLLLRTVFALRQVSLGFRTDHVFVIEPHLQDYKYEKADVNGLVYKPLLERLKTLPGVRSVAVTSVAPLHSGFNVALSLYLSKDDKGIKSASALVADLRASGPELQQVLGFGVVSGRYFNAQDTPEAEPVAVVNRAFVKLYEPNGGDISKFHLGGTGRQWKIVGVIDDFHQEGIAASPMPEIDLNAAQMRPTDGFYQPTLHHHAELMLRSTHDAKSLVPEISRVMREMNPDLAASEIRTMDQIVEDAMGSQILAAHLLEALGGLALVIASAGLYSLLAYLVILRTRELGLRLALGAQREDVRALVLRGAGALLVTGTVIGLVTSLAASRLMHSFLFGVKEHDALSLMGAPALLLLVGMFAAWMPARRASQLEPMEALRQE